MLTANDVATWAKEAASSTERELADAVSDEVRAELRGRIAAFRMVEDKAINASVKPSDISALVAMLVKRHGVASVLAEIDGAVATHCWEGATNGWDAHVRQRMRYAAASMRGRLHALATNKLVVPFHEESESRADGFGPFGSIASALDMLLVRASERYASTLERKA